MSNHTTTGTKLTIGDRIIPNGRTRPVEIIAETQSTDLNYRLFMTASGNGLAAICIGLTELVTVTTA